MVMKILYATEDERVEINESGQLIIHPAGEGNAEVNEDGQ
jgi:hypothetical protein